MKTPHRLSTRNFRRTAAGVLRRPWLLAGALCCSLLTAILWGGNIGALHPVLEVVVRGQSAQAWLTQEIYEADAKITHLEAQSDALAQQLTQSPAEKAALVRRRLQKTEQELATQRQLRARSQAWLPFAEQYLPDQPFSTVGLLVLLLLIAAVLRNLAVLGSVSLMAGVVNQLTFDFRRRFFGRVLRMDHESFHERGASGYAAQFDNDITAATGGVQQLLGTGIREPLKSLACAIGAAYVCWRLLLITLVLAPVSALLIRWLAKIIRRECTGALEAGESIHRLVIEKFTALHTIQSFGKEAKEEEKLAGAADQIRRRMMRIVFFNALTKPCSEILGIGSVSLCLLAGAFLVLNQETHIWGVRIAQTPLSLSSLLVFYGLLIGMSEPLRKLTEVFNSLQTGCAAADRMFAVLDQEPKIVSPDSPKSTPRPHRELVFENVCFRYQNSQFGLRDISFTLRRGETVALVGVNGSGKSTLAHLIPRFLEPSSGRILLDGVDIRDLALSDLRNRVLQVNQRTTLFDDTIENNLRYGSANATPEAIETAMQKARATKLLQHHRQGLQTQLGAFGNRLSGGQQQRLAIARALLRDPDLLILDESSSNLDPHSRDAIYNSLAEYLQTRSGLIITHDYSLLGLAQRVIVLEAGRIIDQGPTAEIAERLHLTVQKKAG